MTRWTILAIAVTLIACNKGERDRLSGDASGAASRADSAMRTDTNMMNTGAAGSMDTALRSDTSMKKTATARGAKAMGAVAGSTAVSPPGANAGGNAGLTGAEAMGGVRTTTNTTATKTTTTRHDLSADQVKQLQTALNKDGCKAGPVDGVMGQQTRRGIGCGLKKHNLRSDDWSGLYRSLGLDF